MGILTRYMIRAHLGPFLFALTAITGLLFLNAVAQRLEDLTGKGLGWRTIADFMLLSLPHTVALTLPMATLVAVLYAFSELAAHNEFTAMKAGGVSPQRLVVPLLGVGIILAELMFVFNDQVLPEANHRLKNLLVDVGRKSPTFELREQVVNEIAAADGMNPVFLTASRIDSRTNRLQDVVIYDAENTGAHRTTYAKQGTMAFNAARTDLFLTLEDGLVLETDPDRPGAFRQLYFTRQIVPLRGIGNELERRVGESGRGEREMTTGMLQEEVDSRREEIGNVAEQSRREARDAVLEALGRSAAPGLIATGSDSLGFARDVPLAGPSFGSSFGVNTVPQTDPITERAAMTARGHASHLDALEGAILRNQVEIQKKYALAFACVVFVLVGAPLAVRFPRGGLGLVIAASTAIFAISWIGLIGGEGLADRGFASPWLAMWAPNLIFLMLGAFLVARMGRETATSRGGGWEELLWSIRSGASRWAHARSAGKRREAA
jgi:lipopolysaccharide export system permease protein